MVDASLHCEIRFSVAPSALDHFRFGYPRPHGRGYLMTVLRNSPTFAQKHVHGAFTGDMLLAFITERTHIDVLKKILS